MNYSKIRTRLERTIGQELWELFEGDIISKIKTQAKVEKEDNYYKRLLEGHSFKVSKELAPKLFNLFNEVCNELEFEEPVDFFITNSPDLNASAISSNEEGEPHIVNINSAIIDKYDDNELKFVIGHELGHIISKNIQLQEVINFVFPSEDKIPLILYNKIILWQKLSELTADRYGLIACKDLEKCISSFFKLSSGLDLNKINLDFDTFLAENEKKINSYQKDALVYTTTHPVNPIRIKALQLFNESQLYTDICNKKEIKSDDNLFGQISELTNLLLLIRSSEMDHQRAAFIASSGLVMATVDDEMNKEEMETIASALSSYFVFPEDLLGSIIKHKNYAEIFVDSASKILKINPGERQPMFDFLIHVALSDNEIIKKEIDFLFDAGQKLFGFSEKEVAQNIGYLIRSNFIPALY